MILLPGNHNWNVFRHHEVPNRASFQCRCLTHSTLIEASTQYMPTSKRSTHRSSAQSLWQLQEQNVCAQHANMTGNVERRSRLTGTYWESTSIDDTSMRGGLVGSASAWVLGFPKFEPLPGRVVSYYSQSHSKFYDFVAWKWHIDQERSPSVLKVSSVRHLVQ